MVKSADSHSNVSTICALGKCLKIFFPTFFLSQFHSFIDRISSPPRFTSTNNKTSLFSCVLSVLVHSHLRYPPTVSRHINVQHLFFVVAFMQIENKKKSHSRFISAKFSTHYTEFNGMSESGEKKIKMKKIFSAPK